MQPLCHVRTGTRAGILNLDLDPVPIEQVLTLEATREVVREGRDRDASGEGRRCDQDRQHR